MTDKTTNYLPIPRDQLPVESKDLFGPPMQFLAGVLEEGLKKNFAAASVKFVECPDLTQKPFGLADKGLCGNPRLLDVGGVPYLIPLVQKEKLYDMKDYPQLTGAKAEEDTLIIGAGAAPWTFLRRNAEMMPNLVVKADGSVIQNTHICRTMDEDQSYKLIALPPEETKMNVLGNLFLCQGEPGHVLEIKCSKRTGAENFVTCMRKILAEAFPTETVGMGGVFCARKGNLKIHVMPDFSQTPIKTDKDVEDWLNFYEMQAPFTCFSVFLSRDPGLDLRVEHTHGLNKGDGQGGHYHYDTTPEDIEYHGYFNLGETIYRVDKPEVTHMIGRD